MTLALLLLSASWGLMCGRLWQGWKKNPAPPPAGTALPLSVIIPVRNEGRHIHLLLEALQGQSHPAFEVIVADDASTDDTARQVRTFQQRARFPLRLLSLPDDPTTAPKKRAIEAALQVARYGWLVTTDGDCRPGPLWLTALSTTAQARHAEMVCGPVSLPADGRLLTHLQLVELASLVGTGGATLANGQASMCNGANLAYSRRAFEAVGGFAGNTDRASGDDAFLLHKIAARFPGKVAFCKDRAAIVYTQAPGSLRAFFNQRRRWAGKWRQQGGWPMALLAVYVFAVQAGLVLGACLVFSGKMSGWAYGLCWLLRGLPEYVFLKAVLTFLDQRKSVRFIPLAQVLYPLYGVFFGLAAQWPAYEWKGRRLR